jgi:transposase InsO family protein
MDFIVDLPRSENRDIIMIMIDKFISYGHFIHLSHLITATEVVKAFLEYIYKLYELPIKVITDRDSIFTSTFWRELFSKLEVGINLSTTYHPQTNGQLERLIQCLEQYLRCMVGQQPKKWMRWLYLAEWRYNTNHHITINMTPFKALYGYNPQHLPMGSIPDSKVEATDELLKERYNIVTQLKEQLTKAQERM